MLVLTRQQGESVLFGKGDQAIRVTVLRNGRGGVKLGIVAPKDVRVVRDEVDERDRKEEVSSDVF